MGFIKEVILSIKVTDILILGFVVFIGWIIYKLILRMFELLQLLRT